MWKNRNWRVLNCKVNEWRRKNIEFANLRAVDDRLYTDIGINRVAAQFASENYFRN